MPKYTPNPRLAQQLTVDQGVLAACLTIAGTIATEATSLAEREAYRTGAYSRGILAAEGEGATGPVAQVQAQDFKSNWVEFGWSSGGVHHAPKAILRRAAETAGYHAAVTHG